MKTIALPEEIYKELIKLKLEEGSKTASGFIDKLILEHKKRKFLEASEMFRLRLAEKKISLSRLLKKSRKIKEEISDEWF